MDFDVEGTACWLELELLQTKCDELVAEPADYSEIDNIRKALLDLRNAFVELKEQTERDRDLMWERILL